MTAHLLPRPAAGAVLAGPSRHGGHPDGASAGTRNRFGPETPDDYEAAHLLHTAYTALASGDRHAAAATIGGVLRHLDPDRCRPTALLVELVIVWAYTLAEQHDGDVTAWTRWAQATAGQRCGPNRQPAMRARLATAGVLSGYGSLLVRAAEQALLADRAGAAGLVRVWVHTQASRAVTLHTAGRCQHGINELIQLAADEPQRAPTRPHSDYLYQLAAMYTACHRYRKAHHVLIRADPAATGEPPGHIDNMTTPVAAVDQTHWLVCEHHRNDLPAHQRDDLPTHQNGALR